MIEKEHLVKVANTTMPFGRFEGKHLIDLPVPYLLWFARNGFPEGELGLLMKLALEIDQHGLRDMVRVLKNASPSA